MMQRLCREIAEQQAQGVASEADVDRLCDRLFLSQLARASDDNLAFVRNRLLKSEADLSTLLDLYKQMRVGRRVADDATNPLCSILKLSGVARVAGGRLRLRNRIYVQVFDAAWVQAHMPDAELRRQQRAYRLGLLRAAGVFGSLATLGALLLGLAVVNAHRALYAENKAKGQKKRADEQAANAERLLYFSDMRLIQSEWEDSNLDHVLNLLGNTRQFAARLGVALLESTGASPPANDFSSWRNLLRPLFAGQSSGAGKQASRVSPSPSLRLRHAHRRDALL